MTQTELDGSASKCGSEGAAVLGRGGRRRALPPSARAPCHRGTRGASGQQSPLFPQQIVTVAYCGYIVIICISISIYIKIDRDIGIYKYIWFGVMSKSALLPLKNN